MTDQRKFVFRITRPSDIREANDNESVVTCNGCQRVIWSAFEIEEERVVLEYLGASSFSGLNGNTKADMIEEMM